jgi:hypothetical protein
MTTSASAEQVGYMKEDLAIFGNWSLTPREMAAEPFPLDFTLHFLLF